MRSPLIPLLALAMAGCASAPVAPPAPVILPAEAPADGSIYRSGAGLVLFEDVKARHVGDVLTILLTESTDAQKKASTNVKQDSSTTIANPTLFGRPLSVGGAPVGAFGLNSENAFSGGGGSTQSNKLQGSVSVQVVQVLANGNLVVRGDKNLTLNQGSETVSIEGIVRPADILPGNTVTSDRVAQARIIYGGKGAVADSNGMGWLSRFFISRLWPF